jgi:hypothetical protein
MEEKKLSPAQVKKPAQTPPEVITVRTWKEYLGESLIDHF